MATIKTTIKRRNGTGWDELRPKTEVDQITDFDANVPDNLDDLTNVNAPSPSDGQALVWDNSTSKWVPGTVAVDISGKVSKSGDTMTGELTVTNPSGNAVVTIDGGTSPAILNVNSTGNSFIEKDNGDHLYIANNSTDKDIYFRIREDSSTYTVAMAVDGSTNRVGIGTTSPGYKLDVAASARVQGDFVANRLVDYGNGNYFVDPASTSNLNDVTLDTLKQNSYYKKTITLSGPAANSGAGRWFVRLWQTSSGATFSGGKIRVGGTWNYTSIMGHIEIDYGVYAAANATGLTGSTRFSSGVARAYDNLRIGDIEIVDGYVGFYVWSGNTNSPYVHFDIYCTREPLFTYVAWASNSLPSQRAVEFEKDVHIDGNTVWHAGNDGASSGLDADTLDTYQASQFLRSDADDTYTGTLTLANDSYISMPAGNAEGIKFGDVIMNYVGTAYDDLTIRNLKQLRFGNTSDWDWNKWAGIGYNASTSKLYIGGPASSYFNSNANPPSIDVVFDGVDNVGIGTTSPQADLHIKGSTAAVRVDRDATSYGGTYQWAEAGTLLWEMKADQDGGNNNSLQLSTASAPIVTFEQNGNVGIGTTSPSQKLDVSGNIAVSGTVDGVDIAAFKTAYDSHAHSQYAPLASPALTGTPTAPTAATNTNNTQIATTAFVSNKIAGIAGGLNFKGTVSLSTAKSGDDLYGTGSGQISSSGDYLIVSNAGDITNPTTRIITLAAQSPGDESDSTLPITLEVGDWIMYQSFSSQTLTVVLLNNNDASKAAATHTHSNYITSNADDTATGLITLNTGSGSYGRINALDQYHAIVLRGNVSGTTSQTVNAGNEMDLIEYGGIFNFRKITPTANTLVTQINSNGIDIQSGNIYADNQHGFINSGAWTRNQTPHGYIDFGPANTSYAHIYTDRPAFYFNKDTLYALGNEIWHSGNDGSGSGLDADTLDTYHATDFVAVSGDTMTGNLTISNGSPTIKLLDTSGTDGYHLHANNSNFYILQDSTSDGTYDSIPFILTEGGNVGIGTTSPGYELNVYNGTSNVGFGYDTSGNYPTLYADSVLRIAQRTQIFGGSGGYYLDVRNSSGSQNALIAGEGSDTFLAALNGKVGIGTTSPSALLEIHGDLSGKNANGARTEFYRLGGVYFTWDGDTYGTQINHSLRSVYGANDWGDHITLNSYGHIRMNIDSNNNGSNRFEVGSHTTGTNNTHFTILDTGNVGIGTTSPAYKLDVAGTARISSTVKMLAGTNYNENIRMSPGTNDYSSIAFGANPANDSGTQAGQWTLVRYPSSSSNIFSIRHQSTDSMVFTTSGNVGIGTSSPGEKLEVNGKIKVNNEVIATKLVDYNNGNYYVDPASTSVLNVVDANRIISENVTTTPDEIGNIKIARLHENTTSTAIGSINNLDTFILSKTDGGYGSGTKPSGSNNAFGVISLQTHTGNYFSQIGFESTGNNAYLRSASNSTSYSSWQKIFHDGYHPNADKWTTARTITLGGDLSGSVSLDGSANVTLTATVANDSHTHSEYLLTAGDTMSGDLTISKTSPSIILSDTNTATGNYPKIQFDTNNNQGIKLYHTEFDSELPVGGYGLVVAPSDNNTQFPTTGTLSLAVLGEIYAGNTSLGSTNKVFHDAYHPNADKWTTARTITLGGDLSGSVSLDGSANVTLSAQVANNSHSHSISNVSGLQTALDDKAEVTYTSGGTTSDVSTLNFSLSGSTLTITTS